MATQGPGVAHFQDLLRSFWLQKSSSWCSYWSDCAAKTMRLRPSLIPQTDLSLFLTKLRSSKQSHSVWLCWWIEKRQRFPTRLFTCKHRRSRWWGTRSQWLDSHLKHSCTTLGLQGGRQWRRRTFRGFIRWWANWFRPPYLWLLD